MSEPIDASEPQELSEPSRKSKPEEMSEIVIRVAGGHMVRVRTNSDPGAVSGAIAGILRDNGSVQVQSIGVGAGYTAIKAIIHAIGHIARDGKKLQIDDVVYVPADDIAVPPSGTDDFTAIRFYLSIV